MYKYLLNAFKQTILRSPRSLCAVIADEQQIKKIMPWIFQSEQRVLKMFREQHLKVLLVNLESQFIVIIKSIIILQVVLKIFFP